MGSILRGAFCFGEHFLESILRGAFGGEHLFGEHLTPNPRFQSDADLGTFSTSYQITEIFKVMSNDYLDLQCTKRAF